MVYDLEYILCKCAIRNSFNSSQRVSWAQEDPYIACWRSSCSGKYISSVCGVLVWFICYGRCLFHSCQNEEGEGRRMTGIGFCFLYINTYSSIRMITYSLENFYSLLEFISLLLWLSVYPLLERLNFPCWDL